MGESSWKRALLVVGLGTFHTAFFMLIVVIVPYALGILGLYLGELNTGIGIGLFLLLWGVTTYCTQRAIQEIQGETSEQPIAFEKICGVGAKWGGRNGVIFTFALAALVAFGLTVREVVSGNFREWISMLSLLLSGLIGFAVATLPIFLVGGLIGLFFSCIDKGLLEISRYLSDVASKDVV